MLGANAASEWAQVAVTVLLGLLTAYIGLSIRQKRRQEIAVSVAENRLAAYGQLWSKIPLSPELRELTGATALTRDELRDLFDALTVWYYADGRGMLLGRETRGIYLTVKTNLICTWDRFVPASARAEVRASGDARSRYVIRQLSLLRSAMRADLEVYGKPWGKPLEDVDREFLYACRVSGWRVQRTRTERRRWISDRLRGRTDPELYLAPAAADADEAAGEPPEGA